MTPRSTPWDEDMQVWPDGPPALEDLVPEEWTHAGSADGANRVSSFICQSCGLGASQGVQHWHICRCTTIYCADCAAFPCHSCAAVPAPDVAAPEPGPLASVHSATDAIYDPTPVTITPAMAKERRARMIAEASERAKQRRLEHRA